MLASLTDRILCRLDDIPDGASRGFGPPAGGYIGLFAVRRGEQVFVYVNSCPHIGVPLELVEHRFLDRQGRAILCATHGARFRIEDGLCTAGPCLGDHLEAVEARIDDEGQVVVPAGAGL